MKYLQIDTYYQKPDVYGNVYPYVRVTNLKTGKSFTTEIPDASNARHIIWDAFGSDRMYDISVSKEHYRIPIREFNRDLRNLSNHKRLCSCSYSKGWKKCLNSIGFRNLSKDVKSCGSFIEKY